MAVLYMGSKMGKEEFPMSKDKSERKSGLAIAGLIIAIFSLVMSWVPILNNVIFIFAIVSLVFGIIGLISIKKGKRVGQGLAIATIIISIVAGVMVLVTQSFYGKVIDDVGSSMGESFNEMDGTNTDKLLESSVDVTLGKFTVKSDNYSDDTKLAVTIKNKSSEKANFDVKIEAVDKDGTRVADDTVYVSDLKAGQSVSEKAFTFVESSKVKALKKATFKVLEVSKY